MIEKINLDSHTVPFSGHVRLIVSDIDGTFLTPKKEISPAVCNALNRVVEAGIPFAFATGRSFDAIKPWVSNFNLKAPQICNNGADIIFPNSEEMLFHDIFTTDTLSWIYDYAMAHGFIPIVFADKFIQGNFIFSETKPEEEILINRNNEYITVMTPDDIKRLSSDKIVLLAMGDRIPQIEAFAQDMKNTPKPQNVCFNHAFSERGILNIFPPDTSKIKAVAKLCNHYSITVNDVMTIGDGDNDADMIQGTGAGVAMGNASPAAHHAAAFQVPDNTADGFAHALEFALANR